MNDSSSAGRFLGLIKQSTGNKGLWIGVDSSNPGKITICKYDGSSMTVLATSAAGYYAGNSAIVNKIDVQLISYGASATVNVYVNSALAVTYSGDVTVSGVTNVDAVGIGWNFANTLSLSEFIVADSDTRSLSLMTMAPTGAGSTDDWTGAYTDVNETTTSDATNVSTNTASQNEQFNVTDLPTGTFAVLAVKVEARAALGAGSTPTGIKLGVRSGGTVGVGSTKTPGTSYGLVEELLSNNPVTSAAWAQSDMNALQIDLQSA